MTDEWVEDFSRLVHDPTVGHGELARALQDQLARLGEFDLAGETERRDRYIAELRRMEQQEDLSPQLREWCREELAKMGIR